MTTRNFKALFEPRAMALVGASNRPGSVGAVLTRNLIAGGFAGPIMTVNPREDEIQGIRNAKSIAALAHDPDLAVLATPPASIPGLITELAARGCRAAIVISAGFGEGDLRQRLLSAAQPHLLRILGPNCLGFLSPVRGINASFAHLTPARGDIAFVSQSGAILTSMLDWAVERGIGFSHVLSLGDASDIDFGDALDYLALDHDTKAILLYIESVTQARKFMSAARIAARVKPVIAIKAGRTRSGAHAAASHTGALAGADAVYDAAIRRAGMLRVRELRDLFDAAATLAAGLRVHGERLTILTNGGGLGVLAADALDSAAGALATLSPDTRAALDAVLPPTWSRGNPVDIIGDADGVRYAAALEALMRARDHDAILVMNCPTGVADSMDAARAVIATRATTHPPPMLACWMGEATAAAPRRALAQAGMPTYETPDEAVRAFAHLVAYGKNQRALLETPRAIGERRYDAQRADEIIAAVLDAGRSILTEPEAKALLAAYGIPTVETFLAATPEEAAAHAEAIGQPTALKILSHDITHKSDVGGVRLSLRDGAAVRAAAEEMLARVAKAAPQARILGFTVQKMIARPRAQELLVGLSVDPTFGPVLLFGQGGTAVEVIADRAIALPPLNSALAESLVAQTRIARLLHGYRDTPAANLNAVVAVILALSDMAASHAEILELDINPLLADAEGVLALDARVVVAKSGSSAQQRLAIRPYPAELESDVTLEDGAVLHVRPIRPEDEPQLIELSRRTSPEDLRLRFHGAMQTLSHELAARLSQVDYDREMALVAFEQAGAVAAVARLVFDPNFEAAEYAIIVRTDMQGRGLGRRMMSMLFALARARGATRTWGDVMGENSHMLDLARRLGAAMERVPDSGGLVRTTFDLTTTP